MGQFCLKNIESNSNLDQRSTLFVSFDFLLTLFLYLLYIIHIFFSDMDNTFEIVSVYNWLTTNPMMSVYKSLL